MANSNIRYTPLHHLNNRKIAPILIVTFAIIFFGLIVLLPSEFTKGVVRPYWDKAADLWSGDVVRAGREAAKGGLVDVGYKQSFRSESKLAIRSRIKLCGSKGRGYADVY